MCPFCMTTAVWITAGAVSTGGLSALALAKFWSSKARERESHTPQGESHDRQTAEQ
jgi:hypothetical protein